MTQQSESWVFITLNCYNSTRLVNCGQQTKSYTLLTFVNQVLLEHSYTTSLHIVCTCFCTSGN